MPAPAKDLKWTGTLSPYDEDFDRISARAPKKLRKFEGTHFFFNSAQEDDVLKEAVLGGDANVIATDAALAHLMTCARSILPWDLVITYFHYGSIMIDVRDPLRFAVDGQVVSETASANQMPVENDDRDPNGKLCLSLEAAGINGARRAGRGAPLRARASSRLLLPGSPSPPRAQTIFRSRCVARAPRSRGRPSPPTKPVSQRARCHSASECEEKWRESERRSLA